MLKDALIGVGIGMLGGMILVKCCPKADKLADEVKSKIANVSNQKESGGWLRLRKRLRLQLRRQLRLLEGRMQLEL